MLANHHRLSRRDFLSLVSLKALSAVVAAAVIPAPVFAVNSLAQHLAGGNDLAFADLQGLGPELDAPDVERYCRALHEEKLLPTSFMEAGTRESVTKVLKLQFASAQLEWRDDYEVGFTYQHYGVPDDSEHTGPLLEFCREAGEYARSRLSELFAAEITWQSLPWDDPVIGLSAFQGYVGRYTYYVTRAVVLNGDTISDLPYLVQAWPVERAIHYIVSGDNPRPQRGTLYIIPGTTSLVAPFSEPLHLTFHEPSQRYAAELSDTLSEDQARETARIAGETINEAAAIVLASEYLQQTGRSERLSKVQFMAENLADSYCHLPKAIAFMRRNSVQNAVDLYFDSPAKFMAYIENA